MKKIVLFGSLMVLACQTCSALNTDKGKSDKAFVAYKQALLANAKHKFTHNQIRSFVYHWFGLHDKHEAIRKSYAVLDKRHLAMVFPNKVIHNLRDYKKWYDNVGRTIKNNLHFVKRLKVFDLSDHKYQVDVVVNWQAQTKDHKFINAMVTQKWILVDGVSNRHPYLREDKVLKYDVITSQL